MRLVGHNLLSYQISGHWVIFPPKAKNEDGYILYQTSSWGLNWNTPLLACPECFRTNVRRQTPSVWLGLKLIHGEIPKWCTLERARTSRMTRWYNPAVSILTWRILFNFPVVRVAGISRRWMIHQLVLNVWRQAQAVCSRNTAGSEISQRAGRGVQQASPGVYTPCSASEPSMVQLFILFPLDLYRTCTVFMQIYWTDNIPNFGFFMNDRRKRLKNTSSVELYL